MTGLISAVKGFRHQWLFTVTRICIFNNQIKPKLNWTLTYPKLWQWYFHHNGCNGYTVMSQFQSLICETGWFVWKWHWHISRCFMRHTLLNITCETGQKSKPWWLMTVYLFNTSDYLILWFQGPTLTSELQRETLVYSPHSFHNSPRLL